MHVSSSPLPTALAHTPAWVFCLFLTLLFLGMRQRRDRTASLARLLALPAVLIGLSLVGIVSSFGLSPVPGTAWIGGLLLGTAAFARRARSSLAYRGDGSFEVRGSTWPLVLMMGIFALRYVVAYLDATDSATALRPGFQVGTGFALGLMGGVLASRAAAAWWLASGRRV